MKEKKEIVQLTDEIVASIGKEKHHAIPILQAMQESFNYLPQEGMERVCQITDISAAQLSGISTFYNYFRHQPSGKHNIRVCVGTACHVKGAVQVYDAIKRELKITGHEDTDKEGLFTEEKVACLGCCTIAPVVQIDEVTYGHVSTEKAAEIIEDFKIHGNRITPGKNIVKQNNGKSQGEIRIGLGSCCVASGSADVKQALDNSLSRNKIQVDVKHVGCVGVCNQVPMLEIHKANEKPTFYTKIKPEEVDQIIKSHFSSRNLFRRLSYGILNSFESLVLKDLPVSTQRYEMDDFRSPLAAFIREQMSIATEHRGALKPTDLDEYLGLGGFNALKQCLAEKNPVAIIDQIQASGLQGRGGGGFPTGQKWRLVSQAKGPDKYVICNGDEGDPGAFMDRMLLESYPFRIIEGLLIAALAVGANKAYFYIRAEYPLAVKRIREGLDICRRAGLIGENILSSGFKLDIEIFEGAGAFICGEETALIASIEGGRGMPKMRPPYPAEKGLWDKPTLINNTETFALIPWIINHGADKFSAIGTKNSKGTKVFALAGKVKRGGLIEVPMGISIRKIVEEIGGGISGDKKFKAVQIGGPSGGCIPASMADIPIDFDSLKEVGAMMGSGGLIVLDESDCMVDIARYFLAFTQDQSCGKCTFCRIGTKRMLEIFDRIVSGKGTMKDLDQLEELSHKTIEGSICGLGKTAPNPVLTTLKYFREEYEMHINGSCPTGKCKELIHYEIDDSCIGCTICAQKCPVDAIENKPYEIHSINQELCVKCDICKQVCPEESVKIV